MMIDNYAATAAERANLDEMLRWANRLMVARPPDVTLTLAERPYLQRWWVIPRNDVVNVYLHRFLLSDDPRALHDHRGTNQSWLLEGEYDEVVPTRDRPFDGTVERIRRRAGETFDRRATDLHRIELIDEKPVISLFFIGPIVRNWGFRCPDRRWIDWETFTNKIGGGCE